MHFLIAVIPDFLEDLGDEIGHFWPIIVFIGTAIGVWRWAIRYTNKKLDTTISDHLEQQLKPILQETQPNGGGSMKDVLNKTRDTLEEFRDKYATDEKEKRAILKELTSEVKGDRARIRALIANLHTAYFEIDQDAKITYVNDSYLKLFGVSYQEAMQGLWRQSIHPDDIAEVDESVNRAFQARTDWGKEFRVIRKTDRKIFRVFTQSFPLIDEAGVFMGYTGSIKVLASEPFQEERFKPQAGQDDSDTSAFGG